MEVCSSTEMGAPGASHLGTGDSLPLARQKICFNHIAGHFKRLREDYVGRTLTKSTSLLILFPEAIRARSAW
jgi:hypothetical protein